MKKYIKCPRCELNYILEDEKYCPVCKAEMKLEGGIDEMLDEDLELCPICGQNFISQEQTCCDECAKRKKEENEEKGIDDEEDERELVQNDLDWDDTMSKTELDEEIEVVPLSSIEDEELFEDEEDEDEDEDEFSDSKEKDELDEDFDDLDLDNIDDDEDDLEDDLEDDYEDDDF